MSVDPPSSGRPTGPPSGPLSGPSQPPAGPPAPPPGGGSGAGSRGGPGGGSGAGSGPGEPHPPWWRNTPRIAAVTAVVVAAAVVAVVLTRPGGGSSAKGGEVFLQAANQTGPDPFTDSTATGGTTPPRSSSGVPTVPGTSTSRGAATSSGTASAPANEVRAVQGSAPGLYSGTRNRPSCDVEKQVKALQADPAKNRAYASQVGVQPSAVPAYLRSLTPVTLRADTRVTNHGYRGGGATSYQAVLQAGTAVLVDAHGVPRSRCVCGNPLTPPVAQRAPRTTGDHWASYRPSNVIVVTPAPRVVNVFVIYDPHHDDWFHRRRGDDTARYDRHTEPPRDTRPWNRPVSCLSSPGTTGTPGVSVGPCPPTPAATTTGPSKSSTSPNPSSPTPSGSTSPGSSGKSPSGSSSESPSGSSSKSSSSESPSKSPSSESPSPSSESPSKTGSGSSEAPSSPTQAPTSSPAPTSQGTTSGSSAATSSAPQSSAGPETSTRVGQPDTGSAPGQPPAGTPAT
ncbi:hypothetical protein PV343_09505 [Streptomyces sp. WI03-4A]|uniref:DUF6777 domain-containing protein n=1 Tax=Streptomyces sp. WI03-4A TaxID=3028706 RepID=UPI0029A03807|nr:DUF6777 domain-containing protein [Streptomyces sp. WI03-4A]MDX2592497.1 hypothetical protein [Streptomyces sp. WI03-4A]